MGVHGNSAGSDRYAWGAISLAVTGGVECMLGLWSWWAWPEVPPAQGLTPWGRELFHPDYDFPIYFWGIVGTLALAILLWRMLRRVARAEGELAQRKAFDLGILSFASAALLVGLHAISSSPRVPILTGAATILVGMMTLLDTRRLAGCEWLGNLFELPHARSIEDLPGSPGARGRTRAAVFSRYLFDAAFFAFIVALLYVPDIESVVTRIGRQEAFHHWDFYSMAPALAFRHGMALGTDFYSQYSVAWPILLTTLAGGGPLTYGNALLVEVIWNCAYFVAVYCFLRYWFGQRLWAFTGTLLCITLHMWHGGGDALLQHPSSSTMRYAMEVPVFWAMLVHVRSKKSIWGLGIGILTGIGVLFATDSGIYLTGAVGCYAVSLCLSKREKTSLYFAMLLCVGWLAALLSGLAIASRGSLFTLAFWRGYLEPLFAYGHGIGNLPIGQIEYKYGCFLAAILGVYLWALCRFVLDTATGVATGTSRLRGVVAIYGLGTLLIFIGRSHPLNLFHPIVPWCLLVTMGVAEVAPRLERRGIVRAAFLSWSALAIVLGMMFVDSSCRTYPGVLQEIVGTARKPLVAERAYADHLASWQRMVPHLKQWDREGARVLTFGVGETACLLAADVPAYTRYCPLCESLFYDWQVKAFLAQMEANPPDIAVLPGTVAGLQHGVFEEVLVELRRGVTSKLRRVGTVGTLEIYARKPESVGALPAAEGACVGVPALAIP